MTPLRSRLLAVVGAGLVLDLAVQSMRVLRDLGDSDFVAFVAGSRLLHTGSLYSLPAQQAAARAVAGQPTDVVYISPPLVAVAFSPFAGMNPHVALAIFIALSLAAFAVAGWLAASRWLPGLSTFQRAVLVAVSVASAPAAYGLALGQLDPIIACAVIAGITLSRRFPIVGGVLIGSLAFKPQLLVLVPVALIVGRHWRVLAGVALSVAVSGAAVLAMGVSHLLDWPRFMAANGNVAANASRSISIPETIARLTGIGALDTVLALVLFVAGAVWLSRNVKYVSSVPGAVAFGLLLTLLASPHLFAYDLVLLAVPLLWLGREQWAMAVGLALALSAAFMADSVLGIAVAQPLALVAVAAVLVQSRPGALVASLGAAGRRVIDVALTAIPEGTP